MLWFVSRLTHRIRSTEGASLLLNRVRVRVPAEHLCARSTQISTLLTARRQARGRSRIPHRPRDPLAQCHCLHSSMSPNATSNQESVPRSMHRSRGTEGDLSLLNHFPVPSRRPSIRSSMTSPLILVHNSARTRSLASSTWPTRPEVVVPP